MQSNQPFSQISISGPVPPGAATPGGGVVGGGGPAGGSAIGAEAPAGGRPIGAAAPAAGAAIGESGLVPTFGGRAIRSGAGLQAPGRPIESEPEFGLPGASIQSPGAYFGGSPVLGPSSIFNIGGAPIAILGGVFSGGLPIGGPIGQIFRSGAPLPNTLYLNTLSPSGPIGVFFLGSSGAPIQVIGGGPGTEGLPIFAGFSEGGTAIFGTGPPIPGGRPIGPEAGGGLML